MSHFVYILANKPHGAIYVGTARDLHLRVEQHRVGKGSEHVARYNIRTLVYFEMHPTAVDAVHRERNLKRWRRAWKDQLIEKFNPEWKDMSAEVPFD